MHKLIRLILKTLFLLRTYGVAETTSKIRVYLKHLFRNPYKIWMKQNELNEARITEIYKNIEGLSYKPLISVILPVYNVEEKWLRKCLDSVINQLYENWELCIADDASTMPHVAKVLKEYAAADHRIKLVFRNTNGHISAASNTALALAEGDYIALLDHDDELSLDALYEVVNLLNNHPEADMIYSDEDKISKNGRRHNPFFKPDWSPDSFFSHMYTCHLGVYRKNIVEEIGGFRLGFEGSQDYDLVLRFTEKTNNIYHVPKVLYHWRTIADSTAMNAHSKTYAYNSAVRVLQEALNRRGEKARVDSIADYPGNYRVNYILNKEPLISIIIPTKDNHEYLEKCLTSIYNKTIYENYEIIIVDNGSVNNKTINLFDYWKKILKNKLTVHRLDIPFNYPILNNEAVKISNGELLLLLNDDTEVITSDWLNIMAGQSLRPSIGAVGAKLLYPDNTVQHCGIILGVGPDGWAGHALKHYPYDHPGYGNRLIINYNYSAVTGACLMMKKRLFIKIGGLDEDLVIACNDVDLCLKLLKAGYYNIVLPDVKLYHHESKSRGFEDTPEKRNRFLYEISIMKKRWGDIFKNDPFYNSNLTRENENFSIRI